MTDETTVRVTLSLFDWVVILAYLLSVVGIGLYFSRTQKTTNNQRLLLFVLDVRLKGKSQEDKQQF